MTLAQLRAALQAKGYGTDTATVQTGMLNGIYRRIAGEHRWPWLEVRTESLATTVGQPSVALGALTDLMWVDAVRLSFGTEYLQLEFVDPQEFRDMEHTDRTNGAPRYWTEAFGELRFYPRPDRVYTVSLDYLTTPPELTLDAHIPSFDTTYHDILVWGAVSEMAFRERDWSAKNFADAEYRTRYEEMKRTYGIRQRQNAQRVTRSGFWDSVGRNV